MLAFLEKKWQICGATYCKEVNMPQIVLECSDNIFERNFSVVFHDIHQILTEHLPTELASCKSRVIRHTDFFIGEGTTNNGFVHLSISVIKGRSTPLLDSIAKIILEKLKVFFSHSLQELKLQITVAIKALPEVYQKYKN